MNGMRSSASRVGACVALTLAAWSADSAAQVCVPRDVTESMTSCEGFTRAIPRRPGGGAGPGALPSAEPERAHDAETPPGPQITSMRAPEDPEIVGRQVGLLRRERQVLERLLGRMRADDPRRFDAGRRLTLTLGEILRQREVSIRELDQPLFEARRDHRAPEVRRLIERRRELEAATQADREAVIRTLATLVSDFPSHRELDEVLFTLAYHLEELRQRQRARQVYHRLLRDFPQSPYVPQAYLAFAEFYFGDGNLGAARQFYERVIAIPPERNAVYGYALYKLAWVLYNEENFRGALQTFVRVLEHTRRFPDRTQSAALGRQARRELVLPYARTGRPGRALAFFRRIAEDEDEAFSMLEALGSLYTDTGQWADTIQVHHQLMAERASSDSLCRWQVRVTEATIASRPKAAQVREATRLVSVRGAFVAASHPRAEIDHCTSRTATTLILLSTAWHREAVGTDEQPGTHDRETMGYAAALYSLILAHFPNLSEIEMPRIVQDDRPSTAQIALYKAEIDYENEQWPECAAAFERALELGASGQVAADASFGAVLCYDRHLGSREPPRAPEDQALSARELTEEERRMEGTFHRFSCTAPGHPEMAVVLYRWAQLRYQANHLEQASVLFRRVALGHPESDVGEFAAHLHLDSLNMLAERRGRTTCYASLRESVEIIGERFGCSEQPERHAEFCEALVPLGCQLAARRAEEIGRAGRHVPSARAYLALVTQRHCEPAPTYLYNAAIHFEAARLLGRAIRVRSVLIESYRDDPLARRSIYLVGANYHALAIYEEAANWYERYAAEGGRCEESTPEESTPEPCPDPAEGLRHAVTFRLGLGQTDEALADARTFERLYGRRRPREAAEVAFAIGAVHERREAWPQLVSHYRAFVRRRGRHATPTQLARANVMAARGWMRQGERGRAEPFLRAAVQIRENGGEAAIAELDLGEAEALVQTVLLRDAVAEALYELAEGLREEYEVLRFPRLRGAASLSRVQRWASRELGPWILAKRELIRGAEAAYALVAPLGIPRWQIAAASRLGDMYYSMLVQVRASPVPEEIARFPDVLDEYHHHLDQAVQPLEGVAVSRYENCLRTATQVRWFDERSRRCESALNRLDAQRFPIASELRGAPSYVPRTPARPGAPSLRPEGEEVGS